MHDVIIDDRQTSYVVTSKVDDKMANTPQKRISKVLRSSFVDNLLDWFIKAVLLSSLITLDFFLYMGAGSYNAFSSFSFFTPEVGFILIAIIAISFVLMYLVSFFKILQNLLLSFVLAFFVIAFLNQFAAFDKNAMLSSLVATYISSDLGLLLTYVSHVVLAIVMGFIFFLFLTYTTKTKIFALTVIVLLANAFVLFSQLIDDNNGQKFLTTNDRTVLSMDNQGKRFVFIGLPDLSSFSYFQNLKQNMPKEVLEIKELQKNMDIALGFYKKNNFMFYPQSYVLSNNADTNLAQTLNANNTKNVDDYVHKNVVSDHFWNFNLLNKKDTFLKEAKLYDSFKKSNFSLNAYQNQGLEFCKINGEFVVEKCIEKNNLPIDFGKIKISLLQRIEVILAQWLESTGLFDDMSSAYSSLRVVADADKIPMIGISYDNIGIKNSLDVLPLLAKDIATQKGNQAYFVNLNLPNQTYIYDEFCQVKQINEWENKKDLPWSKKISLADKRKAYYQQTRCIYGALQDFINSIPQENLENTVIVIQGLSGFDGLYSVPENANFVDEFMNAKFVDVAILDTKKSPFVVNNQVCSAPNVLKQYLYMQNSCDELNNLNLKSDLRQKILDSLHSFKIEEKQIDDALKTYDDWYQAWLKINKPFSIKPKTLPKKATK